uniref:ATP-dependent DNA helicase n=1 Tax=Mycena chlorophos TaxID=658473 RepID=A0ABQ0LMR2_MYCCL|nr:predicted protein [Mycena chlorophos]
MEEALRSYTLPEAYQLLDAHCQLPSSAKKTWKSLISYLARLDPELQARIRAAAASSTGSKRKAVSSRLAAPKRRKIVQPIEREEGLSGTLNMSALINGEYLAPVSSSVIQRCTERFIDKTNNIEGVLVYGSPDPNSSVWTCHQCLASLTKCEMPRFALANNLWIGEVPFELEILTLPEQLLVSIYFPAAYIIKVYPKKNPKKSATTDDRRQPPAANEKLRGNVSSYRLPTAQIGDMVAGNMVPRPSLLLAAVIGVTFVGVGKAAMTAVPGICRVRRQRVFDALMWLKAHNRLYANMTISEENLRRLPDDGVPEEILQNIRFSDDTEATAHEHAGYVPDDDEDESEEEEDSADEDDVMELSSGDPARSVKTDADHDHMDVDPGLRTDDEPHVFPLMAHGVIDVGGDNIPETTLFAHAVENAVPDTYASDYGIRKGRAFVSEYARTDENRERCDGGSGNPNHLLGAFPVLFPYGYGGFEVDRDVKVTYEAHVQWALQYADKRFRKHSQFIFQTFGVLWKRQVCRSTSLHMDHNEYLANQELISKLEPQDLIQASEEENQKIPISNPAIRLLRRHLTTIRARVQGTDESRVSIRAQIWGLTLRFNPPSIWMTINLSDTNDPIAQVLAGQAINLDQFVAKQGPNSTKRGRTIAEDPFAASEYFHIVVRLVLEEMLGISVSQRGSITRRPGVLGRISAYVGTVEAQARGSLHLHLLLWLAGGPTAAQMQEALKSEPFRAKVQAFIKQNIRADVSGSIPPPSIRKKMKRSVAFSRPVDPRNGDFENNIKEKERVNAVQLQSHECTVYYCLKTQNGRIKCKRGYPWPLHDRDWVDEEGNWGAKRRYPFINPWNPPIFNVTRSNMDIKLLTNCWETKDIAFYITLYIAKKQFQAANASAILSESYAFKPKEDGEQGLAEDDPQNRMKKLNKKLFEQCANTLSRQYELSGPEVVGYLMGWGDRYISHTFAKLYWDPVVATLHKAYPSLRQIAPTSRTAEVDSEMCISNTAMSAKLSFENGQFVLQDQLQQYADRGNELNEMSLYEYVLETYHDPLYDEEQQDASDSDDNQPHRRVGRPAKPRVPYHPDSGRKGARVVRGPKQETALHLLGRWLPSRSDPNQENYSAQILTLLKPWRQLHDLKNTFETFVAAREAFERQADDRTNRIVENIQYFHECSESANRRRKQTTFESEFDVEGEMEEGDDALHQGTDGMIAIVDEDAIEEARRTRTSSAEQAFGSRAMRIAHQCGIFQSDVNSTVVEIPHAERATEEEELQYQEWSTAVGAITRTTDFMRDNTQLVAPNFDSGSVVTNPTMESTSEGEGTVVVISNEDTRRRSDVQQQAIDILNAEQRRAHDIIERHLDQTLKGQQEEQLLMIIQGEGGTGKTVLLNAVSHTFDFHQSTTLLAKTGTTGISASLIGGQTLHQWAGIPIRASETSSWLKKSSAHIQKRRLQNIPPVQYLVIDEFSMMTKKILAQLSQILGHVKAIQGEAPSSRPFGNINIILFGDPHQFPPVGNPKGALYHPDCQTGLLAQLGLAFYRQFDVVVTLTQQNRVKDLAWNAMLRRLRHGECTADDMTMLRDIMVSSAATSTTNWRTSPWADAVLVTPRHSCRTQWNSASLNRHRTRTGQPIYLCAAEDWTGRPRRPLSMEERLIVAGLQDRNTARLQEYAEISIGMRAMVLWNIATEADLANGARGRIADIRLDSREPLPLHRTPQNQLHLRYPPAMIVVKLDHFSFPRFRHFEEGELPLLPTTGSFTIHTSDGEQHTIKRRQYALTPGYAFTDYKSQGQTLSHVIVDLETPPHGGLSPFNAYVALSRSHGRENIRILRGFDPKIFTTHPSEHLKDEDRRLNRLAQLTTARYEANSREL